MENNYYYAYLSFVKECRFECSLGEILEKSFAWQVAEHNYDVYVLELSSFQLMELSIISHISPF